MQLENLNLQTMDLVSRLKQYLELQHVSVTQFADECGIPRPSASQLLAGRNKKVSDEIIGKIHAVYPELSIVWLMFGEGDMLTTSSPEDRTAKFGFENAPKKDVADVNANLISDEKSNSEFIFATQPNSQKQIVEKPDHSEKQIGHTFEFANPDINPESKQDTNANKSETFTVQTGTGKRVTGIVVYYDDQTYESFIPDPEHLHPFIHK